MAIVISTGFSLLVFPTRAEHDLRRSLGKLFSDIGLTYGYLLR